METFLEIVSLSDPKRFGYFRRKFKIESNTVKVFHTFRKDRVILLYIESNFSYILFLSQISFQFFFQY